MARITNTSLPDDERQRNPYTQDDIEDATGSKLEEARPPTPRYSFRARNNSDAHLTSGGQKNLELVDDIVHAERSKQSVLKTGAQRKSIERKVRFDLRKNRIRLFYVDDEVTKCVPRAQYQSKVGTETEKREAKRHLDSDEEIEDEDMHRNDLTQGFKKLRLERELDGLRRDMNDGGNAKIAGHHGSKVDVAANIRLRSHEEHESRAR